MSDVRQAAERLRGNTLYHGRLVDLGVLAEAYLAEHPADDEELATDDWLRSVGGHEGVAPAGNRYFDFAEPRDEGELSTFLRLHAPADCGGECMPDLFDGSHGVGITRKWPKTRGDVRRLAAALGIKLGQ